MRGGAGRRRLSTSVRQNSDRQQYADELRGTSLWVEELGQLFEQVSSPLPTPNPSVGAAGSLTTFQRSLTT